MSKLGSIVDSNVHLWDNGRNPVFWLADRSLVRDLLGDYDSLPDVYTLADYEQETRSLDVRGIVWSDAGAADPVGAAEWVWQQNEGRGLVRGMVSLGDPAAQGFTDLVDRLRRIPLVSSVRVRLASDLIPDPDGPAVESDVPFLDRPVVREQLQALARHDLVATIEPTGDQLAQVTRLADDLPHLRIVVDHFGWPTDLSDGGRELHLERLSELAARSNVATRLDALGSIFGSWDTDQLRTWLLPVVERFGPDRCMLGSDLPIERLRSTFENLYRAYDEVFSGYGDHERQQLAGGTAESWYSAG